MAVLWMRTAILTAVMVVLAAQCRSQQRHASDVVQPRFTVPDVPATTVYSWSRDRCDPEDTPDAPPRVIRDDTGLLRMFASHDVTRALTGRTFDHLAHPCKVVFAGRQSSNPADYNDRQWITSLWTSDGVTVAALMHNEFHGHLRPDLCSSRRYLDCWENAITLAMSRDGGQSFTEVPAPANVVASLDYRYQGNVGHPIGYFQPSNIVKAADGRYYVMFHAEAYKQQQPGECVASTGNPFKADSWRAWDGAHYSVALTSPYTRDPADGHYTCRPVGRGSLFDFGSLTYLPALRQFVAVTSISTGGGDPRRPLGVYVATSDNAIDWSEPVLLKSADALREQDQVKTDNYGFFSLIDENSASRSFDQISGQPRLFLYFDKLDQAHAPYARDLVKVPVQLARSTP